MSLTVEIPDDSEALRRICNYPMAIGRALVAMTDNPLFMKDMPGAYLPVIIQIVKKINVVTPSQEIFSRRSTLAKESQKSIETVGRAIRWLEDQGFITREKKAHAGLRGSTCHIQPSQKFTNLLGFNIRKTAKVSQSKTPNRTRPTPPTGKRNFVRIDGKNIPAELAWMVQEGELLVTGLLKLMKLAKASGKRLTDVVKVTYSYLSALRGRELFSYALSLIRQKKDFGFIANQDKQAEEKIMQKNNDKELIERKSFEWRGRRLTNRAGTFSYLVNGNGMIDVQHESKTSVMRINLEFIDAVCDGQLRFI